MPDVSPLPTVTTTIIIWMKVMTMVNDDRDDDDYDYRLHRQLSCFSSLLFEPFGYIL
jgi:hypothetical protein